MGCALKLKIHLLAHIGYFGSPSNILEGHGLVKRHENKDPNTGVVTKSIIPTSKMTAANIKGKTFEESLKLFFYNDTLMTTQTISLLSAVVFPLKSSWFLIIKSTKVNFFSFFNASLYKPPKSIVVYS